MVWGVGYKIEKPLGRGIYEEMVPNTPKAKLFLMSGGTRTGRYRIIMFTWVTRYPIPTQELFTADAAKSYEESNAFADSMTDTNYNILDGSGIRPYMIQMANMIRIRS